MFLPSRRPLLLLPSVFSKAMSSAHAPRSFSGRLAECLNLSNPGYRTNSLPLRGMMRLNPKYIPLPAPAAVLILVFGTGSFLYPNFGTPRVIVNLLGDQAFVGVAAVGESFVILSGGIDLSVGLMVDLVGILIARLLQAGCDPFLAMALAVCFGSVAGAVMGCLIHYFE